MSGRTLPVRSNGRPMDDSWFNRVRETLIGDVIPRNSSGVAAEGAGSLGTSTLKWLRAFISEGYFSIGDFKIHHSYNGSVGPGEGWMLCDGRQITQANYDSEHGAGKWASYIGSTVLLNKYLPDFTNRAPVGTDETSANGNSAIPTVGITDFSKDHVHQILSAQPSGSNDKVYDSSGNLVDADVSGGKSLGFLGIKSGTNPAVNYVSDMYAEMDTSLNPSTQPDSINFQIYMRVI